MAKLIENNGLWLLAIALGVTAYVVHRCKTNAPGEYSDLNSDTIYGDIAEALAKELGVSADEILVRLKQFRSTETTEPSNLSLNLKASFRKITASVVEISITAVYIDKNSECKKTALLKKLSWDELPKDVRKAFIHTGEPELHYQLG